MSDYSNADYITHLRYMIDDDLVIFDDLGSAGHTDWREEVILEMIDRRYTGRRPTIFTSNLTKQEISDTYGKRIASRLFAKENIVVELFHCSDLRQEGM